MSEPRLFSYGYGGPKPQQALADLLAYVRAGAVILDVRLNPWSPNPTFTKGNLSKVLGQGYRHCDLLGNLRYKLGPPVELKDWENGREALWELLVKYEAVVLLCACEEASGCHRKTVADLAYRFGLVKEARHLEREENPFAEGETD